MSTGVIHDLAHISTVGRNVALEKAMVCFQDGQSHVNAAIRHDKRALPPSAFRGELIECEIRRLKSIISDLEAIAARADKDDGA